MNLFGFCSFYRYTRSIFNILSCFVLCKRDFMRMVLDKIMSCVFQEYPAKCVVVNRWLHRLNRWKRSFFILQFFFLSSLLMSETMSRQSWNMDKSHDMPMTNTTWRYQEENRINAHHNFLRIIQFEWAPKEYLQADSFVSNAV